MYMSGLCYSSLFFSIENEKHKSLLLFYSETGTAALLKTMKTQLGLAVPQ